MMQITSLMTRIHERLKATSDIQGYAKRKYEQESITSHMLTSAANTSMSKRASQATRRRMNRLEKQRWRGRRSW
ncbi:unnamed protein product [Rhodiola kirilowii]